MFLWLFSLINNVNWKKIMNAWKFHNGQNKKKMKGIFPSVTLSLNNKGHINRRTVWNYLFLIVKKLVIRIDYSEVIFFFLDRLFRDYLLRHYWCIWNSSEAENKPKMITVERGYSTSFQCYNNNIIPKRWLYRKRLFAQKNSNLYTKSFFNWGAWILAYMH